MNPNLSFTDREFRCILAAVLILGVLLSEPAPLGYWSLMILASIPVITTAIVGWDPLYTLLGISTKHSGDHDLLQRDWSFANVGALDRVARFSMSGTIIVTVLVGNGAFWASLLAAPIMLTAIMAWDPFYALADVNTLASKTVAAESEEVNEDELPQYYQSSDQTVANDHDLGNKAA